MLTGHCDFRRMDTSVACPTPETVLPSEWVRRATCPIFHGQGHLHLCDQEQQWLTVELSKLQGDSLAKWVKQSSKGAAKAKYPILGLDGVAKLGRWVCNASCVCGCKAQALMQREPQGNLVLLSKGAHNHEIEKIPKGRKDGLSRKIKLELLKFVESDLIVPKIICHLESSGFELEGATKKQVKNFLNYKRTLLASSNKLGDFIKSIKEDVHMENKSYAKDECFVVNHEIVDEFSDEDTLKTLMISFSCPLMVTWLKECMERGGTRQITIDATFKIITGDEHILMASGFTNPQGHWLPILYSIVPGESTITTTFHLNSFWDLLGEDASAFFDGVYVLKDAGSGLHSGVHSFFNSKGCKWHQQDCYAHLSRVDGNLQQAFKKYQVPSAIGVYIAGVVRQISYSPSKEVREVLMEMFEREFEKHKDFMRWWKSTYGGPFKNWARCDAPEGYPVSNQGHESNNNTLKKVHMPSRCTQRRIDLHKSVVPLKKAISSLVREKEREYRCGHTNESSLPLKLWEEVDQFMMCTDWFLRQEVKDLALFPSKRTIESTMKLAIQRTSTQFKELMIHSLDASKELVEEMDLQMHKLLFEEASSFCEKGLLPHPNETLQKFFERTSAWVMLGTTCTCYTFQDKGVCKHSLARRVHNNELQIPINARLLKHSKFDRLKLTYEQERTRKQKAREAANLQRKKRFKEGILEHNFQGT